MRIALAALALAWAAAGGASERMTDAEAAAAQLALDRGQLLYAYDRAAWHATDALMAEVKARGLTANLTANGAGYVIEGDTREQLVTFYDRKEPPRAIYRATMTGGGTKVASGGLVASEEILAPAQQELARLRSAVLQGAIKQELGICAQASPNIATLPPTGTSREPVGYLMTPQTVMTRWPIGGHYRFSLKDGSPGKGEPFTKSCVSIGLEPGKPRPAAMMITQVIGDVPTEIHVFTALASGIPVIVGTVQTKRVWAVEVVGGQARIRLVQDTSLTK